MTSPVPFTGRGTGDPRIGCLFDLRPRDYRRLRRTLHTAAAAQIAQTGQFVAMPDDGPVAVPFAHAITLAGPSAYRLLQCQGIPATWVALGVYADLEAGLDALLATRWALGQAWRGVTAASA